MPIYNLFGPQVEPKAACWGNHAPSLHVVMPNEVTPIVGFPPYPTGTVANDELDELRELALLRDDPTALHSNTPGKERRRISFLLQMRPPALGAVYNTVRNPAQPVITTGRELSRYFENETPGLAHRHALNYLIQDTGWSPPRQARAWVALDIAIYSALLAAWYYKWNSGQVDAAGNQTVSYRQRPWEVHNSLSVLFDHAVNSAGTGDGALRPIPSPTPGTPRHPAYPSGHSTYSAAASQVLTHFFPDYRGPLDDLADNTGLARLWAGIHWRSDHTFGGQLGREVGNLVIAQLNADTAGPPPQPLPSPPPAPGTVCL